MSPFVIYNLTMKKTVVTGFGAFGSNSSNPTEKVVGVLEKREDIEAYVLPVVYDRCYSAVRNADASVFLHLGLAASRAEITVERYAYNEKKASVPDNDGVVYSGDEIIPGSPSVLETPFDTERIAAVLNSSGIKASVSTDPGRYVCNCVYYNSLALGRRAVFVHLPSEENLPLDKALEAVERIIEELRAQEESL